VKVEEEGRRRVYLYTTYRSLCHLHGAWCMLFLSRGRTCPSQLEVLTRRAGRRHALFEHPSLKRRTARNTATPCLHPLCILEGGGQPTFSGLPGTLIPLESECDKAR